MTAGTWSLTVWVCFARFDEFPSHDSYVKRIATDGPAAGCDPDHCVSVLASLSEFRVERILANVAWRFISFHRWPSIQPELAHSRRLEPAGLLLLLRALRANRDRRAARWGRRAESTFYPAGGAALLLGMRQRGRSSGR